DRAEQRAEPALCGARAMALQLDEGVTDQPAGEATQQYRHESGDASLGGRERGEGNLWVGHCHIVRGTDTVGSAPVRVTVVVPTYNEAGNIERLCREVRQAVPDANILIVDDASPDGTAELAEEIGHELGRIRVLRRDGKAGLGAAYRAGLRSAIDDGAEICVQM